MKERYVYWSVMIAGAVIGLGFAVVQAMAWWRIAFGACS